MSALHICDGCEKQESINDDSSLPDDWALVTVGEGKEFVLCPGCLGTTREHLLGTLSTILGRKLREVK